MRGEKLLYPWRQRCLTCRSYFGFLVVDRLYCSYACAGITEPDTSDLRKVPRCCKVHVHGFGWRLKVRWNCPEEIPAHLTQRRDENAYHCTYCRGFHTGRRHERKTMSTQKLLAELSGLGYFVKVSIGGIELTHVDPAFRLRAQPSGFFEVTPKDDLNQVLQTAIDWAKNHRDNFAAQTRTTIRKAIDAYYDMHEVPDSDPSWREDLTLMILHRLENS